MRQPNRWPSLADMVRHIVHQQEWMSLAEAANLYRVTPETMRGWARQGLFGAQHSDGEWWLDRKELHSALRRFPANGAAAHTHIDDSAGKLRRGHSGWQSPPENPF